MEGQELRDTLARLLRQRRRWLGLRQRDVARAVGCGQGRVSEVEQGGEDLSVSVVVRFLAAMGYSVALVVHRGRRSWRVRLG